MAKVGQVAVNGWMALCVSMALCASPAAAFDLPGEGSQNWSDQDVIEAFREGTRAYYAGDTASALDGLQAAAQSGHPAAQWKLGRMYQNGDGVEEDDLKAFDYFNQVVAAHAEDSPTSPQAPFVSNAFVEIGSYYMTGIDNALRPNMNRAREIFTYAASYFGDALAQVNLGRMFLDGIGGERDPRQAARWFLLAARKGQVDAQARLGSMLFNGEDIEPNPVHGLMWLTIALKHSRATGRDEEFVRLEHEKAFAVASEDVRRKATRLADQWLADNQSIIAAGQ
ncbi:tetratricopeptide repeat protein [Chthonobacter rhizosphaerae]|uniref:tetratricopeptide repeat protein n=1 Tax=Chthonobacter rhizosphaerae TaxID=2735553 RepID=UPI001FEC6379|nr:SEL1-like repeat protein [Chthonobacter rhizosphaerae]